jgi:hypothetical protein
MKKVFTLTTILVLASCFAQGATINCTVGQTSGISFSVADSNGNPVNGTSYTVSAGFSDATISNYGQNALHCNKIGSTTVTWTINAVTSAGYTGSLTIGPDTLTVSPKSLASATVSYGVPQ